MTDSTPDARPQITLRGAHVLVVGLGIHGGGLGVVRFLIEQGAGVVVTDLKKASELAPSLAALEGLPVRYVLGEHRLEDLDGVDLIVRNPAVPAESAFLAAARARGIPIEMEMGLFLQRCPAPTIGITGTKGKTTTTLMLGAMLHEVDANAVVAGNLRISALQLLPRISSGTPVVLELSSWQLEGLEPHRLSPHISVVTNITPDHLNRYRDFAAYIDAKATIVRWQGTNDIAVLNRDDPVVAGLAGEGRGRIIWFSLRQPVDGVFCDGQDIVLNWRGRYDVLARRSDVQTPGDHNVYNALAACAAAVAWGAPAEAMRKGLRAFPGAEHRLELVAEAGGVRYYNDSAATAPAAALAALGAFAQPLVLIAGGADKNLDFDELGAAIAQRVKALVLLQGTATAKMAAAVRAAGGAPAGDACGSMAAALAQAQKLAAAGDVVLLSPGCASFGMFANEFDRGSQFKDAVRSLIQGDPQ